MVGSHPYPAIAVLVIAGPKMRLYQKGIALLVLYPTMVYRADELGPAGAAGRSALGF